MKKLFFALALLILTTHGALAATCNSDNDKFSSDQWCISSSDTLIPSSSAGQQVVAEADTTATSVTRQLTARESGRYIEDRVGKKFSLPRAAVGLQYTFSTGYNAGGLRVTSTVDTLDTADIIDYSISGTSLDAGDSVKSTGQAGDSVTVTCTSANKWSITQMKAVWTDNGTS